jgi:hypothetical protein
MAVESGVTPWQPKVLVTVPGGVQCPTEPLARDPRALSESAEARAPARASARLSAESGLAPPWLALKRGQQRVLLGR